jgi:hypothetical protein
LKKFACIDLHEKKTKTQSPSHPPPHIIIELSQVCSGLQATYFRESGLSAPRGVYFGKYRPAPGDISLYIGGGGDMKKGTRKAKDILKKTGRKSKDNGEFKLTV